jgi:hypothetical protein
VSVKIRLVRHEFAPLALFEAELCGYVRVCVAGAWCRKVASLSAKMMRNIKNMELLIRVPHGAPGGSA